MLIYKKNIVVGIIMTILLCIYASMSFMITDIYEHDDLPIQSTEQLIAIDIPTHEHIDTFRFEYDPLDEDSEFANQVICSSDVYFTEDAVADFEATLASDEKWITTVPRELIDIASIYFDYSYYDYTIIYNITTKSFNELPTESGIYRMLNVQYCTEDNVMSINEYEIRYTVAPSSVTPE